MLRRVLLIIFIASLAGGLLSGCGSTAPSTSDSSAVSSSGEHTMPMASMSMMPDEVKSAPQVTQQSYQFAVANPDVTNHIPCYCGCGAMGHSSNYSCYVESVDAAGKVKFDGHALGCSICVDITQDAMRLSKRGKSPQDIKAYVDKTYSQYGPSNMK
jgi:hypothetical protein